MTAHTPTIDEVLDSDNVRAIIASNFVNLSEADANECLDIIGAAFVLVYSREPSARADIHKALSWLYGCTIEHARDLMTS